MLRPSLMASLHTAQVGTQVGNAGDGLQPWQTVRLSDHVMADGPTQSKLAGRGPGEPSALALAIAPQQTPRLHQLFCVLGSLDPAKPFAVP